VHPAVAAAGLMFILYGTALFVFCSIASHTARALYHNVDKGTEMRCAQRLLQLYSAVGIIFIAFEWDVQMQLLRHAKLCLLVSDNQRYDVFECTLNTVI
jgi:hypothetical protein